MRTLLLLIITATILPHYALAQDATLISIPGVGGSGFDGYINAVYAMFISIAALLAVVKLIIAGVKYMFSDVVTQKSDAKRDIQGALLGLVVVLSAVLILTVINPNLTSFNLSGVTTIERAPESTAVITTASILEEGGHIIELRGMPDDERATLCETINPARCTSPDKRDASCYKGELMAENKFICKISSAQNIALGDTVRCSEGETDRVTGEIISAADCTEANARCAAAGLTAVPKTVTFFLGAIKRERIDEVICTL